MCRGWVTRARRGGATAKEAAAAMEHLRSNKSVCPLVRPPRIGSGQFPIDSVDFLSDLLVRRKEEEIERKSFLFFEKTRFIFHIEF